MDQTLKEMMKQKKLLSPVETLTKVCLNVIVFHPLNLELSLTKRLVGDEVGLTFYFDLWRN